MKKNNGFTMIEMLIYLGLLVIFMTILVDIFTSILDSRLKTESTSAIGEDSRFILARLSYDLINASSITVPAGFGQSSNTLTFVNNGTTFVYSLDNSGNFLVTSGGTSAKLNSLDTKIDSISFDKIGNPTGKPTVQIIFKIESLVKEQSGPRTEMIQTTLGLR